MTGHYTLEVLDRRVQYRLDLKRPITIIQGDSGTGKTHLLSMIEDYARLGEKSGVTLRCEKACSILPFADWEAYLRQTHDQILFLEDLPFLHSARFADLARQTDNYLVICCRDALPQLDYSIHEIYGMRENKAMRGRRVYNELYPLYSLPKDIQPDYVITDTPDTCHSHSFPCPCVSAGSRDMVWKKVLELYREAPDRKLLVLVDGAAFGAHMNKVYESAQYYKMQCAIKSFAGATNLSQGASR